jgi:hypothetical protein
VRIKSADLDGGAEGGEDHHVTLVDVLELLLTVHNCRFSHFGVSHFMKHDASSRGGKWQS